MVKTDSSNDLLQHIKNNKVSALERAIEEYSAYLFTISRNMSGGCLFTEDFEEITADTFIRLWNSREKLDPSYTLKSYLIRIVKNLTIDRLRSLKIVSLPLIEEIEQGGESIETKIENAELYELLRKHIDRQDPKDREILIRFYYYFQKTKEIAKAMQLSEGSLRTRLCRLRSKLKFELTGDDYE